MPRKTQAPRTKMDDWYDISPDNSPEALSIATGITKSTLSKIKCGTRPPTRDEAFAIEEATHSFVDAKDCPGTSKQSEPAEPAK